MLGAQTATCATAMMTTRPAGAFGMLIGRALFLAACWWAVAEGNREAWVVGGPAVLVAVAVSWRLHPPYPVRIAGLLRFLPMFLWRSLAGGVDVAARALSPSLPIQPALIDFTTVLPVGLPRVVFANIVSLLPGTLSADIVDDTLRLHVLSGAAGAEGELRALERAVADLFA